MMTKFYTGILLIGLSLIGMTVAAADNKNYQIEILIFSQQNGAAITDEIWPEISAVPELRSRKLAYHQQGQPINFFTRLPKSALQLSAKQASLRRSPQYRVLFHEAWVQPVGTRKNQNRIRITGGDILDNGLYEIDGYISVERGRYLHFRTDLYHTRQLSPSESQRLFQLQATEAAPESDIATEDQTTTETENSANGNRYLTQSGIPDFLTVNLNNARRMRSNELHYIDHPLFGALVKVTPTE